MPFMLIQNGNPVVIKAVHCIQKGTNYAFYVYLYMDGKAKLIQKMGNKR